MTSVFSLQNSVQGCFILSLEAKLACYSRYLLTSTFVLQSPVMKRISLFGVGSRRSCRSAWNCLISASLALVVGA